MPKPDTEKSSKSNKTQQNPTLSTEKRGKNTKKTRKNRHFSERKNSFQIIAKTRIIELFSMASEIFKEDTSLAKRYVHLARKISMKHNVPFDKKQKICYCKSCGEFLRHGVNSTLRISKGNIVIKCLTCKHIQRYRVK